MGGGHPANATYWGFSRMEEPRQIQEGVSQVDAAFEGAKKQSLEERPNRLQRRHRLYSAHADGYLRRRRFLRLILGPSASNATGRRCHSELRTSPRRTRPA